MRFDTLLRMADKLMLYKYVVKNVARNAGYTATFMPKPLFQDNGSGMHCHQSLWQGGDPLFYAETGYAGLSDIGRWYIGGLLKHAKSILAFAAPTTNSYKRLVPGYEAPVNLVYSQRNRSAACRIPIYSKSPKAKRVEFRCPDPSANPYIAFAAMLMAGLDGVQNRIEPPDPVDKDLYDLPPEELAQVPQVPASLDEALFRARGRPGLPEGRRSLHRRPDRDLDQLQAAPRDRCRPAPAAPVGVPSLLRHLGRRPRRRFESRRRGRTGSKLARIRWRATSGIGCRPLRLSSAHRRTRGCVDVHLAQSPRGSPIPATVFRRPAPRWRTGMDSYLQILRGR